ncbi:hypothetical protein BDZ89DRAFT_1075353 [Hymenopellis radicata]|nr:hypothetical protein BDZ89DRAFT_1075353 [Hymenopellis radicata]
MQNLPNDILFNIFAILCADGYTVGDNSAAPWNLARVARRWRQTALSHSSLWANITLSITRSAHLSQCSYLPLALERSGTHPLTFSFRSLLPSSDSAPLKHIIPALVALSKETRRWRSAKFCIPTNVIAILLVELDGPFNCLEEIWLEKLEREFKSQYDFSEKGVGVDLSTLFLDAPKIVDVMCDFDIPFQLPWAQLRLFRYHITSNRMIPYITSIPHLCPQLKVFKAQQWIADRGTLGTITPPAGHAGPAILPHLELANVGLQPLLDLMTVPALKTITVQSSAEDDHIVPLIQRSACYDLEMIIAMKGGPIHVMHLIEEPKFTKLRCLMLMGPSYNPLAIFSALRDRASLPALDAIALHGIGVPHAGEHYVGCFALLRVILEVVQAREFKSVSVGMFSGMCMRYSLRSVDRRLDTSDCLAKLEEQARNRGVDLNIMFCAQNFLGLLGLPGMGNFLN